MFVVCSNIGHHQLYTKEFYEKNLKGQFSEIQEFVSFHDAKKYLIKQYYDEFVFAEISLNKAYELRESDI